MFVKFAWSRSRASYFFLPFRQRKEGLRCHIYLCVTPQASECGLSSLVGQSGSLYGVSKKRLRAGFPLWLKDWRQTGMSVAGRSTRCSGVGSMEGKTGNGHKTNRYLFPQCRNRNGNMSATGNLFSRCCSFDFWMLYTIAYTKWTCCVFSSAVATVSAGMCDLVVNTCHWQSSALIIPNFQKMSCYCKPVALID